jgi:hypothetical protein
VPFWFEIVTLTEVPRVPGGVRQRRDPSESTVTCCAGAPPKRTLFVPASSTRNPEPLSVTVVPPWSRPLMGASEVRRGKAW